MGAAEGPDPCEEGAGPLYVGWAGGRTTVCVGGVAEGSDHCEQEGGPLYLGAGGGLDYCVWRGAEGCDHCMGGRAGYWTSVGSEW